MENYDQKINSESNSIKKAVIRDAGNEMQFDPVSYRVMGYTHRLTSKLHEDTTDLSKEEKSSVYMGLESLNSAKRMTMIQEIKKEDLESKLNENKN